jgi:hypothetical protein
MTMTKTLINVSNKMKEPPPSPPPSLYPRVFKLYPGNRPGWDPQLICCYVEESRNDLARAAKGIARSLVSRSGVADSILTWDPTKVPGTNISQDCWETQLQQRLHRTRCRGFIHFIQGRTEPGVVVTGAGSNKDCMEKAVALAMSCVVTETISDHTIDRMLSYHYAGPIAYESIVRPFMRMRSEVLALMVE